MKKLPAFYTLAITLCTCLLFTSCNEENKYEKNESREKHKVGVVYNDSVQGMDVENHKNQFYISRLGQGKELPLMAEEKLNTVANDTVQTDANQMK